MLLKANATKKAMQYHVCSTMMNIFMKQVVWWTNCPLDYDDYDGAEQLHYQHQHVAVPTTVNVLKTDATLHVLKGAL